ncbi:hypothetical protein NVP2275O_393 [Vibrio phage 2.275.O._10N.286.54.E11]|nr:hypothetical protein NVP2275O_393 [Vibrio phage 2.275.O._10N.286.54.E11]
MPAAKYKTLDKDDLKNRLSTTSAIQVAKDLNISYPTLKNSIKYHNIDLNSLRTDDPLKHPDLYNKQFVYDNLSMMCRADLAEKIKTTRYYIDLAFNYHNLDDEEILRNRQLNSIEHDDLKDKDFFLQELKLRSKQDIATEYNLDVNRIAWIIKNIHGISDCTGFLSNRLYKKELLDKLWLETQLATKPATAIAYELETTAWKVRRAIDAHDIDYSLYKSTISKPELELLDYIKSIYNGTIIHNDRTILSPQEIDIWLPELNIGIEFNGTYWHSSENKDDMYHIDKFYKSQDAKIALIQVHESLWDTKQDIVKSRLKSKLGLADDKFYARSCDIQLITPAQAREFCDSHHIQGFTKAKFHYGLFCQQTLKLVGYMSFGKPSNQHDKKKYDWELLRYCSTGNIIGGPGKLMKKFIRDNNPNSIMSYSDNDWNTGTVYDKLNFKLLKITSPGYWYIDDFGMHSRTKFTKKKLEEQGFTGTEFEIMKNQGYFRYHDSGNKKWLWEKQ